MVIVSLRENLPLDNNYKGIKILNIYQVGKYRLTCTLLDETKNTCFRFTQ
jgi:hypothetical protein